METQGPLGIWLYQKDRKDQHVLKDLLQLLKSSMPQKTVYFSYVEASSSLIPSLSLWENLQIEVGHSSWREVSELLRPEWAVLMNIIRNPNIKTQKAQDWEKFTICLLKGLMSPHKNLLIDVNEDLLPTFMLHNFKKILINSHQDKQIYLASANSSAWLDCAHSLIIKNNYEFKIEKLGEENLKRQWIA